MNARKRMQVSADKASNIVDHIYKLAREQRIPHLRFGRALRFRTEAITRWLEEEEERSKHVDSPRRRAG